MSRNVATTAAWALIALLAAGCAKFFGPKTYEEAMKAANVSHAAGDAKKTSQLCERAFELADQVGNGSQAIGSLECWADAASRTGKAAATLPAYARVIGTYSLDLMNTTGRYRLRNDYGVALYQSGKEAEGIAVLEEALAAYKGTSRGGWDTSWERMHIVRNLGKMYLKRGTDAATTAFALEWIDEIEAHIGRSGEQSGMRLGSGPALDVLASLISLGDPARAGAVRERAATEKEGETRYLAGSPFGAKRCHKVTLYAVQLERCFADLP